jgi:hypothetical protein
MGDNANFKRDWHNTVIGEGYQAKGVIRQPQLESSSNRIVDYSNKKLKVNENVEKSDDNQINNLNNWTVQRENKKLKSEKKKKLKKEKKGKKSKDKNDKKAHDSFNPLLQFLATRLSNKTLHFSEENA